MLPYTGRIVGICSRFHNGAIDGSRKTGSLASVRNLYRSLAVDNEWFPFEVIVRGKNIVVSVCGTEVVCYTEPEHPFRTAEHSRQRLGRGTFVLRGISGEALFRNLAVERLGASARNETDTLLPADEQSDYIIRLQQRDFPVIDYHVRSQRRADQRAGVMPCQ